jgi:beta-lactamase superfamily II metal-dependent hydrolase
MRILCLLAFALLAVAQPRSLSIYWIDTEGGAATLIVTPDRQSLLADTGNAGNDDRDAKRIAAAAKEAGLTKLDFVLITHFHLDHVGGVGALAKLIPIGRFLDHGDSMELGNPRDAELWKIYQTVAAGKRTTLKPGNRLPLTGVESVVVTSNGATIAKPLTGGGPNAFCAGAKQHDPDTTENQRSLGFLLTYGKFKFLDLGDLTWDKEMELACPVNKLGTVTLLQATHHGFYRDYSGAPAHVWALKPQVVVANNGPQKGMQESAWETISKIQGLQGVWQAHLALGSDAAHNAPPDQIANLEPTPECQGHWLKASVSPDGKFTLTNSRNGFSKSYTAK